MEPFGNCQDQGQPGFLRWEAAGTNLGGLGCFSMGLWVLNSSRGPGANLDVFVVGGGTAQAAQMHLHPRVRWPWSVRVAGHRRLTLESGRTCLSRWAPGPHKGPHLMSGRRGPRRRAQQCNVRGDIMGLEDTGRGPEPRIMSGLLKVARQGVRGPLRAPRSAWSTADPQCGSLGPSGPVCSFSLSDCNGVSLRASRGLALWSFVP